MAASCDPSGDQVGKANVLSPAAARTTRRPRWSTSDREPSVPRTAIEPEEARLRPAGSVNDVPALAGASESVGVGSGVSAGATAPDASATADPSGPADDAGD